VRRDTEHAVPVAVREVEWCAPGDQAERVVLRVPRLIDEGRGVRERQRWTERGGRGQQLARHRAQHEWVPRARRGHADPERTSQHGAAVDPLGDGSARLLRKVLVVRRDAIRAHDVQGGAAARDGEDVGDRLEREASILALDPHELLRDAAHVRIRGRPDLRRAGARAQIEVLALALTRARARSGLARHLAAIAGPERALAFAPCPTTADREAAPLDCALAGSGLPFEARARFEARRARVRARARAVRAFALTTLKAARAARACARELGPRLASSTLAAHCASREEHTPRGQRECDLRDDPAHGAASIGTSLAPNQLRAMSTFPQGSWSRWFGTSSASPRKLSTPLVGS
jgi:hypothetical protein